MNFKITKKIWLEAVSNNDREIIEKGIRKGISVHVKKASGKSALMIAAEKGYQELVDYLLKEGADLKERDQNQKTAVILAGEAGQKDIVRKLIEKGALIHEKEKEDGGLLIIEALKKCESYETYYRHGAKEEDQKTIQEKNVKKIENKNFVKELIEKSPKGWGDRSKEVVVEAMKTGDLEIIQWVMNQVQKDKINLKELDLLHKALRRGVPEVLEWLIQQGWDPNEEVLTKYNEKVFLLKEALSMHQNKSAKVLIHHQANVNYQEDVKKETLLMQTCQWNSNEEMIEVLLRHGAEVNAQNKTGETALMLAAETGSMKAIEWLLKAPEIDVSLTNVYGMTAKQCAMKRRREDIVNYLEAYEEYRQLQTLKEGSENVHRMENVEKKEKAEQRIKNRL